MLRKLKAMFQQPASEQELDEMMRRKYGSAQPWWMHFPPQGRSRPVRRDLLDEDQPPIFQLGDKVRLIGKPEKVRQVIGVEWHAHCHEYAYAVETETQQTRGDCPAYWFAGQLERVG